MRTRRFVTVAISLLVAVAAVGVGVVVLSMHDAKPTLEMIFSREAPKTKRFDLFAMAIDGTHIRLLARDATAATASPDGRRIAFVRGGEIFVMQRDGSHQHRVTRAGGALDRPAAPAQQRWAARSPAWSHDGRILYFSRIRGASVTSSQIVSMRADGAQLTILAGVVQRECTAAENSDPHECNGVMAGWEELRDPAPAPRGKLVAFTRHDAWADQGDEISATTEPAWPFPPSSSSPSWSPDGVQLAYTSYLGDLSDTVWCEGRCGPPSTGSGWEPVEGVYVARVGRREQPLRVAEAGQAPAWSPDGRWIAFEGSSLALVHPDGTGLHVLGVKGLDPAWLPPIRSDGATSSSDADEEAEPNA